MTTDPRRDALERVLTYAASDRLTDLDDGDSDRAGSYVTSLEAERDALKAECQAHNGTIELMHKALATAEAEVERLRVELHTETYTRKAEQKLVNSLRSQLVSLEAERNALKTEVVEFAQKFNLASSAAAIATNQLGDCIRGRARAEKVVEAAAAFVTSRMGSGTWDAEQRTLLEAVREHEENSDG